MDFGLYRVQGEEGRLSFHKRLALHGRPGGRLFLFLTSGGSRREIDSRQDHRSARCPQQRKTLVQDDIGQQNGTHGFRKDEKPHQRRRQPPERPVIRGMADALGDQSQQEQVERGRESKSPLRSLCTIP